VVTAGAVPNGRGGGIGGDFIDIAPARIERECVSCCNIKTVLQHFNVYSLILGLLSFNSLCKYLIYIHGYYFGGERRKAEREKMSTGRNLSP
jgi:hypothetical protein